MSIPVYPFAFRPPVADMVPEADMSVLEEILLADMLLDAEMDVQDTPLHVIDPPLSSVTPVSPTYTVPKDAFVAANDTLCAYFVMSPM